MNLSVAIPPYAAPVSLTEMKNHLKVELDEAEDDSLILSLIPTAADLAEAETGSNSRRCKVLVATTFDASLSAFPHCNYIEVPRVPLVSVTSITYVDTDGTTQTLSSSVYSVNTIEGRIYLAYGQSWPSTRGGFEDKVTVRFVAGMVAPFSAASGTDILTISGRSFAVGDRVRVMNSGGKLPAPLALNTDYFVIAGPKLSLTSGGVAIDITGAGEGTHFVGVDLAGFETLRSAMKLLVGHWYQSREAAGVTPGGAVWELPLGVQALIHTQHA